MRLSRITRWFSQILLPLILSCSKQESPNPNYQPSHEGTRERTAADTTLAGQTFARAEQFGQEARYDSAIVYFEKTSRLYEADGSWQDYANCYNKMGQYAIANGTYDRAKSYLDTALAIGRSRLEEGPVIAETYHLVGLLNRGMSDYPQALAFCDRALSIRLATFGGQHWQVAESYEEIGNIYLHKGDIDQAISFHEKSLAIRLAILDDKHPSLADTYNTMAGNYWYKGDYDKALDFCNKALSIWLETLGEAHPRTAQAYGNIGILYAEKGEYAQALTFSEKALSLRLATLGENHPKLAYSYNNLGQVYGLKGDHDQAIAFSEKAIDLWGQRRESGNSYHTIGYAYWKKGGYDRALEYYFKALSILEASRGDQHPDILLVYNDIALVYADKGDFDRAIASLQQAITVSISNFTYEDPYSNPPLLNLLSEDRFLVSLERKAEILSKRFMQSTELRDLEASVATYELASRLIDQMRSGYKTQGSKLLLAKRLLNIYDKAIQTTLQLYDVTSQGLYKNISLEFSEKSKAGILLESLSESEARQFAGIPDSLLEKERQLRIDLAYYDRTLAEEQIKREAADSANVALWKDRLFSLNQAYERLLKQFEQNYPEYYNLKYQPNTASVREIQEQILDNRTALIEYFNGSGHIFVFTVTSHELDVATVTKDSLFEQQVAQLRQAIIEEQHGQYAQTAFQLYQTLVAPVADKLSVDNLIIVPDGILSAIPFEVLLTKQASTDGEMLDLAKLPYLINDYTISYTYSATLLQQTLNRKRAIPERDYLAFAPVFTDGLPIASRENNLFAKNIETDSQGLATRFVGVLPETKKEVTAIENLFKRNYGFFERRFGSKSSVYLESDATEEKIKLENIEGFRYLHFATHGFVSETNPKLSGLVLQEDEAKKEDGLLLLGEIYNMNLNADLVVLSACETGLGQVAQGEGIIGLTRGFLYAGAANLLVSLWQVSDVTTSDVMVDFYREMLSGSSKAQALRAGKLRLIQSHPEYAKPYYWAPFILIGK